MNGCEFFGGKTKSINSLLAKDFPHCDPGLLYEIAVRAKYLAYYLFPFFHF